MTVEHLAVDRDLLAGADNHDLADATWSAGISTSAPSRIDTSGRGRERGQVLDGAPGALGGEALDGVADAHEDDDHQRGHPLADGERREHAERHQVVSRDLAAQRRAADVAEDGEAGGQDQERCRPARARRR